MIQWRIGCAGYRYPEWKGLFYPQGLAENKWFDFYSSHFNFMELNSTYYRFPHVELIKKWYQRSPLDFAFSVKAPGKITHYKKLKDSQRYLSEFYEVINEGLREKAHCILFQFPAAYDFKPERLEMLLSILDPSFRNVVEFRHPSWWQEKVYQLFREHGTVFCGMSHPHLPDKLIRTADMVYYRFQGAPHLYVTKYEPVSLDRVLHEIQRDAAIKEACICFNNTGEGAAVINARQFQEICELVH